MTSIAERDLPWSEHACETLWQLKELDQTTTTSGPRKIWNILDVFSFFGKSAFASYTFIYIYTYMCIYIWFYIYIYIDYGLLWLYTSNSRLSLEKTSSFSILFESWRQVVRRSSSFVLRERVDFVLRTWSGSWSSRTCFVTCTYFDYWDFHGFPMK